MAVKKSVSVIAEELRMLNETAATDKEVAGLLDWFTPDFWTTAGTAVTNIIAVAAVLGWIDRSNVEGLTQAIVAVVGAAEVVVMNSVLVWKYLNGRQELRAQVIDAKFRYMESIAIEKLRAERPNT